jgi:hypothetical protein
VEKKKRVVRLQIVDDKKENERLGEKKDKDKSIKLGKNNNESENETPSEKSKKKVEKVEKDNNDKGLLQHSTIKIGNMIYKFSVLYVQILTIYIY